VKFSANVVSFNEYGFLTTTQLGSWTPVYLYHNQNKKYMKTRSLFIAAIVIVSSVAAAFGKEEPANAKGMVVVPVKNSEVFKVIYKGENTGKVKLNVYSGSQVVFSETFNHTDGFIRPLNFSGLKPGAYTVEVVDAFGKKSENIMFATKESKKNVHVSRIPGSTGKYLVALAGFETEVVRVNIYDGDNNLVHSEAKSLDGDAAKLFNIKQVSGGVTFEVSDANGFTKVIRF
jgi:hypothetical protein